ncbi:DUF397 domain-containing protein [Actinomadura atramentaria]|uniref:DUF397 domain-containing protein n=1 Tax=Actinomadura atramentaria TaxID=1990 RepID=UPI00037C0848|nr:DUF397 domain-containing protein [Actinomadura atramentaria]
MNDVQHVNRQWRTSSHSGTTECVEVGRDAAGVAIRDSKRPEGGLLAVGSLPWRTLVCDIKDGRLGSA